MDNEEMKINYEKRPIPSGPGAQQIRVEGQESTKGGSPFTSPMPEKFVVPGETGKAKGGFSSRK